MLSDTESPNPHPTLSTSAVVLRIKQEQIRLRSSLRSARSALTLRRVKPGVLQ